jgi:CHAT domain-containing protein
VKIIDLGEADPIDGAVATFRQVMLEAEFSVEKVGEQSANESLHNALDPLAELIWKPLAEHVADCEELLLSPDGALWLVPWAALPIGEGKCLLEKYRIRYLVSGRELAQQPSSPTGISPPVVMADPNFDVDPRQVAKASAASSTQLIARRSSTRLNNAERLPGTAREARSIKANLGKIGGAEPAVYLDNQATETQFKALFRPRVLVLSTHGFFLEEQKAAATGDRATGIEDTKRAALAADGKPIENPLLRCGLLLAGCNRQVDAIDGNVDDGVLTGLEIVGTDLRGTEMVVLSACETGVGEIRSGEGVAGLRQAFQLAGAQSVVATLWKIPDQETAQLMNDFFVYLSQGKSRSEALRYAQLAQIQSRRERYGAAHPYYWAAFTLTGKN